MNIKSDNDSKELIHHIVMVCFFAREYNKTIVDSSKTFRDEIKALDDNMVSQKKLIKELNKLLKECSKGSVSYSNVIPKTSINESTRKLLAPVEPNVANYLWSPDFIHEVLEAYLKFLPSPFGGRYLKDHNRPLEFYEIRLGALEYPKRPAKQAHRKKLQENSLIFNLACF